MHILKDQNVITTEQLQQKYLDSKISNLSMMKKYESKPNYQYRSLILYYTRYSNERMLSSPSHIHVSNTINTLERDSQLSQTRGFLVIHAGHSRNMDHVIDDPTHQIKEREA